MPEVNAVKEPGPDPKAGKPRPKSGVSFPYYNLEKSVEVARIMHDRAGGTCDRAQLAAMLGYSGVDNGSFLTRVAAAKMFGLIEQDGVNLRVSTRARSIIAPISEAQAERARAEAFLNVDLFKRIFDQFNGQALPAEVGLRNLLETQFNVVKDRVTPTVNIMLQSAEQAGLFKAAGANRMVMPLGVGTTSPPAGSREDHTPLPPKGGGGSGDDGGSNVASIHPAILGLLRDLPAAGTSLTAKRRGALIGAFTAMIGFIYPEAESE